MRKQDLSTTSQTAPVALLVIFFAGIQIDGAKGVPDRCYFGGIAWCNGELAGYSVAGAGDFNGDGHNDVIVGAPGADNNGRIDSGSAYIVYGFGPGIAKDPACGEHNNQFATHDFDMDTPITYRDYGMIQPYGRVPCLWNFD